MVTTAQATLVLAFVIACAVVASMILHPNASQVRAVCAQHGGLASVDVPLIGKTFVTWRDGYGAKR
jgi:hypothetical protein